MRHLWFARRLRAAWGELTPLVELGETPRALAAGRVLGRAEADARCYLVLSDRALVVVVKARRSGALLRFLFEDLAYVGPALRFSGKRTYEVWTHAWPGGPRGLAFAVERSRRGVRRVAGGGGAKAAARPAERWWCCDRQGRTQADGAVGPLAWVDARTTSEVNQRASNLGRGTNRLWICRRSRNNVSAHRIGCQVYATDRPVCRRNE